MARFDINTAVRRSHIGVVRSQEFRRIEALPRRVWDSPDLPALAEALTEVLKTEGGTMRLRPAQAAALKDVYEVGGLFGPLAVGSGKSLVTLTAPVLLGSERPVLLLPAALREQTRREVIPRMGEHWKLHPNLRLVGYEELGIESRANLLDELAPDLIVADEVHCLANVKAGRSRRVARYLDAHPGCRFAALSGTITRKSLRDYAHLLAWCLRDGSPLPLEWGDLQDWADCLDADVDEGRRLLPGALMRFCRRAEVVEGRVVQEEPRAGYARRLRETPGVVATGEDELGCSLVIAGRRVEVPDAVLAHLRRLRTDWELPSGDCVSEATELWRHARSIACGFVYIWWNHEGFTECLTKILKNEESITLEPESTGERHNASITSIRRILKSAALATARDTELVKAVERLRSSNPTFSLGTCGSATDSQSNSTSSSSLNSTDGATSAGMKTAATGPNAWGVDEAVLRLTTTTLQEESGVSFARRATERLACWETVLRAYPALLPMFAAAIDAATGAPREWLKPRRVWKKFVRQVLSNNHRKLDTELQVWNDCAHAVARGESRPEYSEWLAVRDTFEPNSVPVWQSKFLVEDCVRWLAEVGDGIVWVEHAAFLEALGEAGVCCYGPGEKASREILTATGPIACSVRAHGQGRNLQRYSRALWVVPPSSGRSAEQHLGRLHRFGQTADEVRYDVYLHTPELRESLAMAQGDAQYIQETTGVQQKLCIARILTPGEAGGEP